MIRQIAPINFLEQANHLPVIDVRSPAEFAQGHIPGAANIPIFDNEERAVVGTLYVQSGRDAAVQKGMDIAFPKSESYIEQAWRSAPGGTFLLHCWRGGLRSDRMAKLFSIKGLNVQVLDGGYKAYRRFIRERLTMPVRIMVLGGRTGSGKTDLLQAMAARGEQVIDLEALACHKGSVFGAFGQKEQPTNEQFENDLYKQWSVLDPARITWLEDESRMIGRVTLPDPLVEHINSAEIILIETSDELRIARLVRDYAGYDKKLLAEAIGKIRVRLGGQRTIDAMKALEEDRFDEVAAITLAYYDKAYAFAVERRNGKRVFRTGISGSDAGSDADHLIEFSKKCLENGRYLS